MRNTSELEVNRLKQQLTAYVDTAKSNERKLRRFQEQELQFIKTSGLEELLEAFFVDYRQRFAHDTVSLLLVDPNHEIRRILDNLGIDAQRYPELLFTDTTQMLTDLFGQRLHPLLGCQSLDYYQVLFPSEVRRPNCIAAFPLIRQGQPIGCFNIGSLRARRYTEDTATDFLQRLVEIFAVCFENAINNEKIKLLGLLDPLTGVHNRRYFDQRLTEEISHALRQNQPLSCLFLDIDHFKSFNDNHGHHVGDLVLREVAGLIKSQMRLSDVMARFGGEEFAILLPQTGKAGALEIGERIRHIVANHPLYIRDDNHLHITLSVGCSTLTCDQPLPNSDKLGQELIGRADAALYEAKREGRNQVCFMEFLASSN